MKSLDEFKERILNDKEFIKKFENAESKKDILEIAKRNGYCFTNNELESKELDEALKEIAGGIDVYSETHSTINTGSGSAIIKGASEAEFDSWLSEKYLGNKSFDEYIKE